MSVSRTLHTKRATASISLLCPQEKSIAAFMLGPSSGRALVALTSASSWQFYSIIDRWRFVQQRPCSYNYFKPSVPSFFMYQRSLPPAGDAISIPFYRLLRLRLHTLAPMILTWAY